MSDTLVFIVFACIVAITMTCGVSLLYNFILNDRIEELKEENAELKGIVYEQMNIRLNDTVNTNFPTTS